MQAHQSLNRKSAIANRKYLGWLIRPGSQQLGAKWVEVTKRRNQAMAD
jgi:hypothetical protein